jgi:hypothetical protein
MRARAVLGAIAVVALVPGMSARASSTAYPSTPLERFGPPTEGYEGTVTNASCYRYQVATRTVPIRMGGTKYPEGFQVSSQGYCAATIWTWTWHLGGHYSGFAACVGLAGGDTKPATLSFVGPKGMPTVFQADGVQVRATTLVAGLPTFVIVGTTHLMNLIIRTTTAWATIGFGDDGLYPGDVPVRECE